MEKTKSLVAGLAVLATVALANAGAAAPPTLYKLPAKALVPTVAEAGFDRITSQSSKPAAAHPKPGLVSSWTADYESADAAQGVETVGVMVFRSEAAAGAQYDAACGGCDRMMFNGWRFKRSAGISPSGSGWKLVTLVAACRNVVVGATRSAGDNKDHITTQLRATLDALFSEASSAGMTACGTAATPLPSTGKYYWSEAQAEAAVVRIVKIPYCNVYSNDPDCQGLTPFRLQSADCRGSDERGTTFTYSRFTCDVVVYNGYAHGRIAVYPTGSGTLRWKLL